MKRQTDVLFEQDDLLTSLEQMDNDALDELDFGVIGINDDGVVCRFNACEIRSVALSLEKVVGNNFFTEIALCMNNYLVAQRFDDAKYAGVALDETIDYVLTWKMRPTQVKLRMLRSPQHQTYYVVIKRLKPLV